MLPARHCLATGSLADTVVEGGLLIRPTTWQGQGHGSDSYKGWGFAPDVAAGVGSELYMLVQRERNG